MWKPQATLVMRSCNLHKSVCWNRAWKRSDQNSGSGYTGFMIRHLQSLSPTSWKVFLRFTVFKNLFVVSSKIETDCKSDQQGCQSPCSEQNTFYLVLIDILAEALHTAYCYQKIEVAVVQDSGDTTCCCFRTVNKVAWQVHYEYGMLQSVNLLLWGCCVIGRWIFWFNAVWKRPEGLCVEEDIFWVMQTQGGSNLTGWSLQ